MSETFQMFAPALTEDPRYEKIRDALDAAQADLAGDSSVAARCRDRAMAFLRAGRPLDALHELHEVKINWWHGDTLRGALLTMRMIGKIYGDLDLQQAARQYALTAAAVAASHAGQEHEDLLPAALAQAMAHTHAAGHWGDALALGGLAFMAHHLFADTPEDYPSHGYIQQLDFHASMVMLSAERFRPTLLPTLRKLTDADYLADLDEHLPLIRPSFTQTEQQFVQNADDQLTGRPFSDVGAHRDLNFAALGTTWRIRCDNIRATVLAAERFTAAVQISLAELAPHDPLLFPQDILVRVITGTPLGGGDRVTFRPNNHAVDCTVILSPYSASTDHTVFERELSATVVHLLAHLSARPTEAFMSPGGDNIRRRTPAQTDQRPPLRRSRRSADRGPLRHPAANRHAAVVGHSIPAAHRPATRPAHHTGPRLRPHQSTRHDPRQLHRPAPGTQRDTAPCPGRTPTPAQDCGNCARTDGLTGRSCRPWPTCAANLRLQQASPGSIPQDYPNRFFRTPESHYPTALPLSAFTVDSLRAQMDVTLLAVAQRRWKLGSAMPIPQPAGRSRSC
ncbi:hypothetical protein ACRAWF_30630 [Streptomyces sp. L7]